MNKNNTNVYFNYPTDYLSCDLMRSKFLDTSLFRRMVEKTVCNDYQIWKWTSCTVKGSSYPSFEAYTIGNERAIKAKIQKQKTWENTKLQILRKVHKNVGPSHKVIQSAAAHGQLILTRDNNNNKGEYKHFFQSHASFKTNCLKHKTNPVFGRKKIISNVSIFLSFLFVFVCLPVCFCFVLFCFVFYLFW